MQKNQGIANGTPGGLGQQQAAALCDISAQLQQYQQFLGEQRLRLVLKATLLRFPPETCVSVAASGADASRPLPVFADFGVQDGDLPDGVLVEDLKAFQALYREHCEVGTPPQRHRVCSGLSARLCMRHGGLIRKHHKCVRGWGVLPALFVISSQAILDVMVNLQFTLVETLWKSFWRFSEAESLSL